MDHYLCGEVSWHMQNAKRVTLESGLLKAGVFSVVDHPLGFDAPVPLTGTASFKMMIGIEDVQLCIVDPVTSAGPLCSVVTNPKRNPQ